MGLEEKLLQARSAELRAKRDTEAAQGHQARLHHQLASAREEAQDLSSTLTAMRVQGLACCCRGMGMQWAFVTALMAAALSPVAALDGCHQGGCETC